uniref:Nuclear receptor domain-containing protein n=1 Tax=Rhabditophanes sp. KR3021 TaxID=114890 RepID=A0AC35TVU5_9BILA
MGPSHETDVSLKDMGKSDFKLSDKEVQHCLVCEAPGASIYYKCLVCQGCKSFFRRVIIEGRIFKCRFDETCVVNVLTRNSCRKCRFSKCIDKGMNKDELNEEKRRKRKNKCCNVSPMDGSGVFRHAFIDQLAEMEDCFVKIMASKITPIYNSIDEGFKTKYSIFRDVATYDEEKMEENQETNFSYWRAKTLSVFIEWCKCFDFFNELPKNDRHVLIINTSFSFLVLSEAFHTPVKYTDRIVFPDGLAGYRNISSNTLRERKGLIPTVVAVINNILVPIRKMEMDVIEYALLQVIIFLDRECISLSPKAIEVVYKKRTDTLTILKQYLNSKFTPSEAGVRFGELLLRIPNILKVSAFKRETLSTIETFNLLAPHPLTMEISTLYPLISFF